VKKSEVRESIEMYGVGDSTPTEVLLEILGLPNVPLSELLEGVQELPKSARVKCESFIELVRRITSLRPERPKLTSPKEAFAYFQTKALGWKTERFGILALNSRGFVIADRIISQGTATGTLISPKECFSEALRLGAISIIAYHNHPSGDPEPSAEDIQLTRRLRAAGEQIGIILADHIILGNQTCHSFRANEGWDRKAGL